MIQSIRAIREKASLHQVMKFIATGGMNTLVDFVVLNALILAFGLAQGDPRYIYFKGISYIVASCNSFILNKRWVFGKKEKVRMSKEIGPFVLVSILGLFVNTLVSLSVFHMGAMLFPSGNSALLANLGAISGTLVVLVFNFLAYKFLIFK